MPFTPFHLGAALGLGLPLSTRIHVPTFLVANVIVDVEPFLVLVFGLRYPLHGYLHSFLLAFFVGLGLGYTMCRLESRFHSFFMAFRLAPADRVPLRSYLVAGVTGMSIHVLLDSPLYRDIHPFFPWTINPLYNPTLSGVIYGFCGIMGLVGSVYYLIALIYRSNTS